MSKISSFLTSFILSSFQETPIEQPTDTTEPIITNPPINEQEETSPPPANYLWLLFFDLIIFCGLTYLTYNKAKNNDKEQKYKLSDFQLYFIKWLFIANGARSLSLLFILAIGNPVGNYGLCWLNTLLHVFPAFLFVSTYMYLVTFLSNLYYNNIGYVNHIMEPALNICIKGGYILLGLIGIITLLASKFLQFYYISEFLMAFLYLILGGLTIFYGRNSSNVLISISENLFDSSAQMAKIVRFMSYSIGGLFLLKGVSGVMGGFGAIDLDKGANVYDFFWFLVLEILPTLIYIYSTKSRPESNETIEGPRLSDASIYQREKSTTSFNDFNFESNRQSYKPPAFELK